MVRGYPASVTQLPPALSSGSVEQGRISHATHEEMKRERILAAMTNVFAKRGYPAATVDHLIAGAKISMGGFYNHFEGKEDCFVQVYDRVRAQAQARIDEAMPPEADWAAQATGGLRALVDFVVEEPLPARIVLLEAQTGGELALKRYGETLRQAASFMRRGREAGDQGRDLPTGFEEATTAGIAWLLQNRLARGELETLESLYPQMAKEVLEPYLGREKAARALRAGNR
jgi:AcrR family transcriptional regulator